MKILVSTANMGLKNKGVFVKQEIPTDFKIHNNENFPKRTASFTNRMKGKIPKMLSWKLYDDYDYYIWIDAYYHMRYPHVTKWFINNIGNYDALFFKHPDRNTIFDEANYMIKLSKKGNKGLIERINGEPILEQIKKYKEDKNFNDNFLINASCFCYSSKLVKNKNYNMMKEWYFEVCTGSIRDQLSLPYVLQKFNVNFKLMKENTFKMNLLK